MKEKLLPIKMSSRKFIFTLLFFLLSCTNPLTNKGENNFRQIASFQKEKTSRTTNSFPINYIIRNSTARKSRYNLSRVFSQKLRSINNSFFKKWFDKSVVNISGNDRIIFCFSPDDRYYFFDYLDSDSVFFCSIIEYPDDYHTFRLYHFTIDKQQQLVVDADWIAAQSRKSTYCVNNLLTYNSKGNKLIVNSTITSSFRSFRGYKKSVRETFRFSLNGTSRKTFK